ncbi:hypothetical protein QA612_20260 [Evansella sp. AB-P1]|uniref:hypothetical protein n=1 Tax=Evansella sp. AB-P1 TaxID=3037653 RepID=UPI00241F5E0C|nr:hypothetical protein [Evansella sp. AB-P1]MDG5789795.1 hypothetical protein [Evansella sp. AB-P1]
MGGGEDLYLFSTIIVTLFIKCKMYWGLAPFPKMISEADCHASINRGRAFISEDNRLKREGEVRKQSTLKRLEGEVNEAKEHIVYLDEIAHKLAGEIAKGLG